jgi:hypothetical protein
MPINNSNNSSNNNYSYKYNNNGNNFKNYNNFNNKYSKSNNNDNNYSIILSNLKQFKRHIDNNNNCDNFNWNNINSLIDNSNKDMKNIMQGFIDSCITFTINNDSFYYVDLYIKSIFNFYSEYFNEKDINDIKDIIIKNLLNSYKNINNDKNYYLEDIWVIIIYYLLNNQILEISDFNIFNKENNNIKNEIANIFKKVIEYNYDTKNYFMKEIKNSNFYKDNKTLFD